MLKVLVIDDDEGIIESITEVLKFEGYTVYAASSVLDANQIVKHIAPDIVLLDLILRDTSGELVAKALKENPKTKNIPIIMISAHPSARTNALLSGANDFIAKPFEMDELIHKITQHTHSKNN